MTTPSEPASGHRASVFEQSCKYCGARFEVSVAYQAGSDAAQDYGCPECGKDDQVRAARPPTVRLISPRTDGKTDRYQETMF